MQGVSGTALTLHLSNPAEFPRAKIREWDDALEVLRELHGAAFGTRPGRRGHITVPLTSFDPHDAAHLLRELQAKSRW